MNIIFSHYTHTHTYSHRESDSTLMSNNKQMDSKPRWQQKLERSISGGPPSETSK